MKAKALAVLAAVALTASAAPSIPNTGFDLLRILQNTPRTGDDSVQLALAQGLIIGELMALEYEQAICIPKDGVVYADAVTAVRAYLEQNTDKLGLDAGLMVAGGLFKAFPCKK